MKKRFKILLWSLVSIIVLAGALLAGFIYKVKNGFPVSYETEAPAIVFPDNQTKVLVFSKTTGFRHGESIDTGKKVFTELAKKNNWFVYNTEEGGVFNQKQLAQFAVVIFNNSTGRVLNEEQQKNLEEYVQTGGSLIGIHGAGDNSHHNWEWYEQNLIGTRFSHHSLHPQLQVAEVLLSEHTDGLLSQHLPESWSHTEEWYVFFDNPKDKGFNILYRIDGEKINPNGNLLWMTQMDFGMGKDHPVAWYRNVGSGFTFYTSMGHNASAWRQPAFVQMLENAIKVKGK